jgi:hypothetical protein
MIFAPIPGLSLIGIARAAQWAALFCASAVDYLFHFIHAINCQPKSLVNTLLIPSCRRRGNYGFMAAPAAGAVREPPLQLGLLVV